MSENLENPKKKVKNRSWALSDEEDSMIVDNETKEFKDKSEVLNDKHRSNSEKKRKLDDLSESVLKSNKEEKNNNLEANKESEDVNEDEIDKNDRNGASVNQISTVNDEKEDETKEDDKSKQSSMKKDNEDNQLVLLEKHEDRQIVNLFGKLTDVLSSIQTTNLEILKSVNESRNKLIISDNEKVILSNDKMVVNQTNNIISIENQPKADEEMKTSYKLYVKYGSRDEVNKIRQKIRDDGLLDGTDPVVFESFVTDMAINEVIMEFKDAKDHLRVSDCLKDNFVVMKESTGGVDKSQSVRFVIYGFKDGDIKNAADLKAKLINFNKELDYNGNKIYNNETLNVDQSKFVLNQGSAAIVEFYGPAINKILEESKLRIDFGVRQLVKYYPIKICANCCSASHSNHVICEEKAICYRCSGNHPASKCVIKDSRDYRCFACTQTFKWGPKVNHMFNALTCYHRKNMMINLNKEEEADKKV